MPPSWSLPHRLMLERRYNGPIPPADSPWAGDRDGLFLRLAAEQRRLAAARRRMLAADQALMDRGLRHGQEDLRFYRDQGVAWWRGRRD
ncbi:hypothetical protein A6A04_01815 [Paramagnetospirillum marisnigri]|uniref:Uncharacterized protein n=1 Tax=Paramagnetospirillum marisnigri TaxID=1285242 RepID=A0A178MN23_9PROT|nr:hypothetical protein [Paramagnetospirillum marisnigri]OAN50172.1 hypothetical protein A6A04_01815 [Paramagnetospirillum marisnigri]